MIIFNTDTIRLLRKGDGSHNVSLYQTVEQIKTNSFGKDRFKDLELGRVLKIIFWGLMQMHWTSLEIMQFEKA